MAVQIRRLRSESGLAVEISRNRAKNRPATTSWSALGVPAPIVANCDAGDIVILVHLLSVALAQRSASPQSAACPGKGGKLRCLELTWSSLRRLNEAARAAD